MARIVHVSESLATGVLSVLLTLVRAQVRDGHEVVLIGSQLRSDTLAGWQEQLPTGARFIDFPMQREVKPLADLQAVWALRKLLTELRPDAVHLHSSKAGALGRAAALGLPARVVYQPHGVAFMRRDVSDAGRLAFGLFEVALARLGGTVVACSQGELTQLQRLVPRDQTALVKNGIDLSALVAPEPPRRKRPLIGTSGRISAQKDPAFFAAVARALRSEADFLWIGDGDAEAKELLAAAGVRVTGWRLRPAALAELGRLDIYIQTSAWEGMPISVIEAMALGLPVVATDIAGNHDILAGSLAGFLVATPDEMAAQLRRLSEDLSLRVRTGEAARRLAHDEHTSDTMSRAYYALYGLR